MKNIFTLLFLSSFIASLSAQNYCGSQRYDSEVFSQVSVTTVVYGSNVNVSGNTDTLTMDIYQPVGDTATIRPLIVFAHGGSFLGGSKADQDQVDLCTAFAKRGYVTATINYRLGIGFPINQANAKKAVWRATQDMKAAVRFFRKDAATTNTYMIDPNMIIAGGTSAGAFMALHLAYLDQPSEIPSEIDTTQLGGIEGNSGNPGYSSTVNAVVNLCGALGDADYMIPGDVPVVSMHGDQDQTVPYGTDMLYILGSFQIMVVDGSRSISLHADSISVPNAFYTYYNRDHVPFYGTSATAQAFMDTTIRFVSNFLYSQLGCTPSDPTPYANAPSTVSVEDHATPVAGLTFNNPAHGSLAISWKSSNEKLMVSIIDITGRAVKQAEVSGGHAALPLNGVAPGTYLLKMSNGEKILVEKLVVY